MRKYAISKVAYISLILILISLCIGYTYAYFSAYYDRPAELEMGYVNVIWTDGSYAINNGDNSISIGANNLSSDSYSKILALNDDNSTEEIDLWIENTDATVPAYCRIKIEASYTPSDAGESKPCGEQWIQLAYKGENSNPILLTSRGWFYHNGYYYYGNTSTKALTEFWIEGGIDTILIADHLYLSPTANADIFGSQVSITLTVEAIQTTNGAVSDPAGWGVTF